MDDVAEVTAALLDRCARQGLRIATAESCTGGLLAGCLTETAGASAVFERGFVTYSNAAKVEMLDVPASLIERHGAVSAEVARAMAMGTLAHAKADLAAAITGIAGPDGGSPQKPVGLVWIGVVRRGGDAAAHRFQFTGDRTAIRRASVRQAVALLTGLAAR